MRIVAQRVEKEDIETLKQIHTGRRNAAVICEIGAIAEAEAMRNAVAVIDFDGLDGDAGDFERSCIEDVRGEAGATGLRWRVVEYILEGAANGDERVGGSVDRDIISLHEVEGADVVEAEDVVGVRVRVKNCVEPFDVEAQGLVAEIGSGIDEDSLVTEA